MTEVTTRKPVIAASGAPAQRPAGASHLTDEQVAQLGRELDAIRDRVVADLGTKDAQYIRRMIRLQRSLDVAGRVALFFGKFPPLWFAGVGMLSLAKILENMEIGHNVIHGQWDWMRDPDIHSTTWEWDFVAPAEGWKHTHNDLHHTYTNVIGKDSDVGYDILRVTADQPWEPRHRFNVPMNMLLAPFFEWGIAIYDLELPRVRSGAKSKAELKRDLKALGKKILKQVGKDYTATPLLAQLIGGSGLSALAGTFVANMIRNLWAHSVIFCGHFPDGVEAFSEESIEGETRGDWYLRQMLGSANISGSKVLHILTGNLSHQVEHHLFPDLPSNRYAEVAPEVRELCARYGLPYISGPMWRQIGQSWRTIARLSSPKA